MKKLSASLGVVAILAPLFLPAIPVHAAQISNGRISYDGITYVNGTQDASQELYIANEDDSQQSALVANGAINGVQSWSPDGNYISYTKLVSDGSGGLTADIFVVNSHGTPVPLQLTHSGDALVSVWSQDSTYIYYSKADFQTGKTGIYRVKADGSASPEVVADDPNLNEQLVDVSPDDTKVAYMAQLQDGSQTAQVYVKSADGSGSPTQLTHLATGQSGGLPIWSPDGQKLAFQLDDSTNNEFTIEVMNADGSNLHAVTPTSAYVSMGTYSTHIWSPDSTSILYTDETVNGYPHIYLAHADGSTPTALTSGTTIDGFPNWSADGQKIVFQSLRNTDLYDIYSMNKDGGNVVNLTNTPTISEQYPVWETKLSPLVTAQNGVTTTTIEPGDNFSSQSFSVPANNVFMNDGSAGATTVQDGGMAKGHGTYGDLTVQSGGTLAPGNSPGCLNSGNLVLSGTYQEEIGGTTACSGYDRTNVTGTVNLSGSTLDIQPYNGFTPSVGDAFTVITNDGSDAVTGTFNGLVEGASVTVGTVTYAVSYHGGDGNDVTVTVTNVAAAPGTPDTGFALVAAHPLQTLFLTLVTSSILLLSARSRKIS